MTWQLLLSPLITIPALVIAAFLVGFILYSRIKGGDPVSRPPGCNGKENCMCFSCQCKRDILKRLS